mmetsp:Transcript_4499/g.10927  ORF Transcript_4499/g.10927 Transcript_4499/m.10927 type:complete len:90 (-) Transcript_4499:512-781(-)
MRSGEFRNRISLEILAEFSTPERPVYVFRNWELLVQHPELHAQYNVEKGGARKMDCTHWCHYEGNVLMALARRLLSQLAQTFWAPEQAL